MSAKHNFLCFMVCGALFLGAATELPAPIYMKYGTIKGEVLAEGYKDWIEIDSTQLGVGRSIGSPVGGQRDVGRPNVSEIVVTKVQDLSSPYLFAEATLGKPEKVEIHFLRTFVDRAQPYLKLQLDNTLLSGYSQSSGGDRPAESLSLNFTKITLEFISYDAQGGTPTSKTVSYDIATGTGTGP